MRSQELRVRWLRLLLSVVSAAVMSATVVPAASAQIIDAPAPPSPVQVDVVTISNLAINGQLGTLAAVAPGAGVTITARVSEDRQGFCPNCIAFVPVKFAAASAPAGCLLNGLTGGNNVVDGRVTLTAPTTLGVYDVVAGYALQFVCNWELAAPEATIARIVVTNKPPSATNDAYATDEGTTLRVGAPGVLGNDTDPDGDALAAVLVSGPDHGDVSLRANGSFSYFPAAGFHGSDAFTYRASDSRESSVATVTIAVRAVSQQAPPAPPAAPAAAAAPARAAVSDVAESARCYRNARLGEPPTQGRQAMSFSYRLSAASTVRLSVLRRTGSPHWRRCPPRRGHRPGHYGPVDSRTGPGAAGVNNTTIGSTASVRKTRRSPGRVVRHQAPGRHTLTLAQVTGRPLPAGTYILQVTALDSSGAPLSRQHVKFWVFTSATAR